MGPPQKPFQNYKWRWATFQPTESLNDPPVFLGVLRVFNRFQNQSPGTIRVMDALGVVQEETHSRVDLVRTQDRNLLRNSGQYWKALGLLQGSHGKIVLSPLGQLVASGKITPTEFALSTVKTLELPNRQIEDDPSDWEKAGLRIKPLELLLDVLAEMSKSYGSDEAYITPPELRAIIIPLAGTKAKTTNIAKAMKGYREGSIDVSQWPDCAPESNDKRMAREFLLFLSNYGFCSVERAGKSNDDERYFLASISPEDVKVLHELSPVNSQGEAIAREVRETGIPANVERKRVLREVLDRPQQPLFRKNILIAFSAKCLITGVTIEDVLEACHIIGVQHSGSDKIENGLCLRSDIHQLFDSGHLRIRSNGEIFLSEGAQAERTYNNLPNRVRIPNFVNRGFLDWRFKYR